MEHREDHNEIPEFTLEDILAEFGAGADLYRRRICLWRKTPRETAPAEAPAQQEAPAEPEPPTGTGDLCCGGAPREAGGTAVHTRRRPGGYGFPGGGAEEGFPPAALLPE